MAQGVLEHLAADKGLNWTIDSAGTGSWHVGEAPDRRAIRTCHTNGIDISGQRARQFAYGDFDAFDLILTMDETNRQNVLDMSVEEGHKNKVHAILQYAGGSGTEVPDPYYNGRFQEVFDLLWESCNKIVESK